MPSQVTWFKSQPGSALFLLGPVLWCRNMAIFSERICSIYEWRDAEEEPAEKLIVRKLICQFGLWFNLVSSSLTQAGFRSRWWFRLWELWRTVGTHWFITFSLEVSSTVRPVPLQVVPRINTYTLQTLDKGSSDQPFLIPLMLCNSRWKRVCISTRNLQCATLISWLQGTSQASVTKRPKPSRREAQTNFDTMKSIWEAHSLWLYDN